MGPILKNLHWLPFQYRIDFNFFLLLVHRAVSCTAPQYLSDLLTNYHPIRSLRSSDMGLLNVPKVKTKSGKGGFSRCGAVLWNKLPADPRSVETLSSFKSGLKTLLFSCAFGCLTLCMGMHVCASVGTGHQPQDLYCVCVCVCVECCMGWCKVTVWMCSYFVSQIIGLLFLLFALCCFLLLSVKHSKFAFVWNVQYK